MLTLTSKCSSSGNGHPLTSPIHLTPFSALAWCPFASSQRGDSGIILYWTTVFRNNKHCLGPASSARLQGLKLFNILTKQDFKCVGSRPRPQIPPCFPHFRLFPHSVSVPHIGQSRIFGQFHMLGYSQTTLTYKAQPITNIQAC